MKFDSFSQEFKCYQLLYTYKKKSVKNENLFFLNKWKIDMIAFKAYNIIIVKIS